MQKQKHNGFTIIELLVTITLIGILSAFAFPNIASWITKREVKKEVYEVVAYIQERKSEVTNGKYGMTQLRLKPNLEVYTMSLQNFSNTYHSISSNSSYKRNYQCDYGTKQSGFVRNRGLETLKLSVSNNDSKVHVYPNAAHNPVDTTICITKDGSISFMRTRKTERDPSTRKYVDIFIFCSKSNTDQRSCKYNANLDYMHKITLDRYQNIKIYTKDVKKNSWKKIDG